MINCIVNIFEQYSLYAGTGIFMGLYFVTLIYLIITEKNPVIRTVVLHGSMLIILCILLPCSYYFYVNYVDESTYWRNWWLIPSSIVLAYVGAKLIDRHVWAGLVLLFFIFSLGGNTVYAGMDSIRVENMYHLPQTVIDICDFVEENKDKASVTVVMPSEYLDTVRQYDVNIDMPYGVEQYMEENVCEFYMAMEKEIKDYSKLILYCEEYDVDFLVMKDDVKEANKPENNGFTLIGNVDGYNIFRVN